MPGINYRLFNTEYSGGSPNTTAINTAGHYVALIFQPTPGKTITGVEVRCASSTAGVVDFTLETVDAAAFVPSGTLVATGVSATSVSLATNTWYTNTFTNSYTVPQNATDYIALVVRNVSGTCGIAARASTGYTSSPRIVEGLATVTQRPFPPTMSVVYSDGTRQIGCVPFSSVTAGSNASTASPDEYGNIYLPDTNQIVVGIQAYARVVSGGQTQFRIYDENLNVMTVDAELLTDVRQQSSTSGGQVTNLMFKAPIYLIAGKTYYITATAMSANATYTFRMNFDDANRRAHFSPLMYGASRTDWTGAFTTDTTVLYGMGPIIDANYGLARDGLTGGIVG